MMKQKLTPLAMLLGIALYYPQAGAANADPAMEMEAAMRAVLDAPAPQSAPDNGKPAETAAALKKEAQSGKFQPPAISEIFNHAKRLKITADWRKRVKVTAQNYTAMPLPERAFAAGTVLADIAFLVLSPSNENQAPSLPLVQYADEAVLSLNPPENIKQETQQLKQRAQNGDLKGAQLRNEITRLLNEQIPQIEQDNDPGKRDSGVVMVLSGYLRALHLGAQTLAEMDKPSAEQLGIMKALRDTVAHYDDYLQ
ncbi:hypothetical protein [Candidatus Venteria ishoeyi]|uniref:Uncharacterized protein n=1 Tax=Candidatus Venteria ishoeyi TaxID=1899563 RepID=A0A1H6F651_9GAMM|nr:hypothetical protein [Candidatus Venteria ishoeyi]SEH04455.1 Uncharacterised protein [Candidatus Venteria ishoeyi]